MTNRYVFTNTRSKITITTFEANGIWRYEIPSIATCLEGSTLDTWFYPSKCTYTTDQAAQQGGEEFAMRYLDRS